MTMTLKAGASFKSLWDSKDFTSQSFQRRNDYCQWRRKKRPSPSAKDQECSSKRFASEELVTDHLRELHISTSHTSHTPHTHPLVVTAVTDCPGQLSSEHRVTENLDDHSNVSWYPWQQHTYNIDDELSTVGTSPVMLVDDLSSGGSWQRGEDMCLPVCPIRAQPSGEEIWKTEPRVLSPAQLSDHALPDADDEMMLERDQAFDSPTLSRRTPNSSRGTPCSSRGTLCSSSEAPCSSPHTCWRQVTLDDGSSESSDSASDGPERPLSVWIAPEVIQCARRRDQGLVPQSLLEKYNKFAGMEVVLWVDPSKRLKVKESKMSQWMMKKTLRCASSLQTFT